MTEYQDSHFYEELKESDLYILTEFFKVLGNPTRIRILLLLMEQDSCVGDLAKQLGMTQSAVSHQLNLLKSNKLVRLHRIYPYGCLFRIQRSERGYEMHVLHLFAGSPKGAAASAGIYALVETAKANSLDAMKYLKYILSDMPVFKEME